MKKSSIYIVIIVAILVVIIGLAAYATLTPIVNVENMNTNTYLGGQVSLTTSGGGVISGNISSLAMSQGNANNTIELGNAILNVTMTSSNDKEICCSYDIVWEWDQTNVTTNQYSLTTGATKEYTLSGSYDEYYGNTTASTLSSSDNSWFERQLQNYNASALSSSMTRAKICNNPDQSSKIRTQSWNLNTNFYNLNLNQDSFKNATFIGKAKVANVSCYSNSSNSLADFIKYEAPRSGTDAVSSSPWILTSDHEGELRYAGKNPDNYIEFNGELWRIIGVMPNMEYCTGTYGTATECDTTSTGSLIKIIRNQSISSSNLSWDYKQTGVGSSTSNSGSNDWSDSQLMLMLNGTNYLKTGYDVNGNKLHQSYTITSNVVKGNGYNYYNATYSYLDGNGQAVYTPSQATTSSYTATSGTLYKKIESSALNQMATVKWDLYGTATYAAEGSPSAFYNKERNIGNTGAVYNVTETGREKRAVYWYGKVGLMYLSDYGYATNGGNTYNRDACLDYRMAGWNSGDYKTDCATNSYLWYNNITSTAPGTSGTNQWTMTPYSDDALDVFIVYSLGHVNILNAFGSYAVRPVLYLKADTVLTGGTGTWNDPYTIASPSEIKSYWFDSTYCVWGNECIYPNYGGTLQSNGTATGHNIYIGQDGSKYYACATMNGHEICLSQPYTQYGLSEHTLSSYFTSAEQASAKQALYQAFLNTGIVIDIDEDCGTNSSTISCQVGLLNCDIYFNGRVQCFDYSDSGGSCTVDSNSHAYCGG